MQTVPANFTAEAREPLRKPVSSLQVSWKKGLDPSITIFTVGVSAIGGSDIIGGSAGVQNAWAKYEYFDESDYLLRLAYEYGLNLPGGGLTKGMFDLRLNNTSGRFTPHYMGGSSELYTAILPRRPMIINAGFNYSGIDNLIPQFVGVNTRNPQVNERSKVLDMVGSDFLDFLQNKYVDDTAMYTDIRSDELIQNILTSHGYSTAEFRLDYGINLIKFAILNKGDKLADIINEIVQAEYGHFYQNKEGRLLFENRQHWDASPFNEVQAIIHTAQVLDRRTMDEDSIINSVEVLARPRVKQPADYIFNLQIPVLLEAGENEFFVDYEDPVLQVSDESFAAFDDESGLGTDRTANISIKRRDDFAQASKYVLINNHTNAVFLTDFSITGRAAEVKEEIYVRKQDDSSLTAFDERPYKIENKYIQSKDWADSFAQMILDDFAEIENMQEIEITALPYLEIGDLISWQGRYWRIFHIQNMFDPFSGFIQRLKLLQRDIVSYFRIGISTIGGTDKIAP